MDEPFIIDDNIPYRPMDASVQSVTIDQNQLHIQAKIIYTDAINDIQEKKIIRSHDDVKWLNGFLQPFFNWIPFKILADSSILPSFLSKGSTQQADKALQVRTSFRFFKLLLGPMLKFLKTKELESKPILQAIFVFFHDKFSLYKNPIYFKAYNLKQISWKDKLFGFSKNFYGFFSKNQQLWPEVKNLRENIDNQNKKFIEIKANLENYVNQLKKLPDQFYQQIEKINKRYASCKKVFLQIYCITQYYDMVIAEAQSAIDNVKQQYFNEFMKDYALELQKELKSAEKEGEKFVVTYIKIICEQ